MTSRRMHHEDRDNLSARKLRDASSLLDVVMGMAVLSLILIPTAGLLRDVLSELRRQSVLAELELLAQGTQAECAMRVRQDFQAESSRGTYAANGFPELRFETNCSDSATRGGIPNRLMSIHVHAWHDVIRNRRRDPSEEETVLWTAIARAR